MIWLMRRHFKLLLYLSGLAGWVPSRRWKLYGTVVVLCALVVSRGAVGWDRAVARGFYNTVGRLGRWSLGGELAGRCTGGDNTLGPTVGFGGAGIDYASHGMLFIVD
jgi:hypothetical protein